MLAVEQLRIDLDGFSLAADFTLPQGARAAVLGPSGAGKSTLLGAIAGFVPPTAGRILWQGRDLTGVAPGARPLSILFQDNNLFAHLTAAQNVGLALAPSLRLSAQQRAAVQDALEQVGLAGMGGRMPAQLSGGQMGRVALARALLRARPVLLLDEPFAALGPALKAEMLGLVGRILSRTGATLLMVTHDPGDAEVLCDSVIVVADGEAQPPRPTAEVLADPPAALRAYLG